MFFLRLKAVIFLSNIMGECKMKKLTVAALIVPTLLFIAGCGPKARSQSDVDSPEYHF